MKILHTKSPCCRGDVRKFGKRRSQCKVCLKTWRARKKKRGRKRVRPPASFVKRYLARESLPLKSIARKKGRSREWIRRRLTRSLNAYLAKNAWEFPPGESSIILIADAMWQEVEGKQCSVYFCLIRPVDAQEAWILEPLIIPDQESMTGWEIALEEIPRALKTRIRALVCDGEPHLVYLGRQHGWIIQRCHFHLLASIKNYVTSGPLSRNREFGRAVLEVVNTILTAKDEGVRAQKLDDMWVLLQRARNRRLRSRLSGFIKHADDYVAYLRYPELQLPVTTNAAESLIQCVRDMLYRMRGLRSISSFYRWVRAICLAKKKMRCSAKIQPN